VRSALLQPLGGEMIVSLPLGTGPGRGSVAYNFVMDEREERSARLRSMTDDECRSIIADIFSLPLTPRRERLSGLVEQQRLFRKLR